MWESFGVCELWVTEEVMLVKKERETERQREGRGRNYYHGKLWWRGCCSLQAIATCTSTSAYVLEFLPFEKVMVLHKNGNALNSLFWNLDNGLSSTYANSGGLIYNISLFHVIFFLNFFFWGCPYLLTLCLFLLIWPYIIT